MNGMGSLRNFPRSKDIVGKIQIRPGLFKKVQPFMARFFRNTKRTCSFVSCIRNFSYNFVHLIRGLLNEIKENYRNLLWKVVLENLFLQV